MERRWTRRSRAAAARRRQAAGRDHHRIVAFMREHYGRGPIKAKTYVLDNLIVCVLSDGFTAIERTMMEGGEADRALETRLDFQRMMKQRYSEMIQAAHRPHRARVPQPSVRRTRLTVEMFLMDGRLAASAHSNSSTRHPAIAPARTTDEAPALRSPTSSAAASARHRAEPTECQRRQTRTHAPASAQRRRPRGCARGPYPAGRHLLSQEARVRARPPLARARRAVSHGHASPSATRDDPFRRLAATRRVIALATQEWSADRPPRERLATNPIAGSASPPNLAW